jgi:NAD(P)-dependent dehydrogenase (short-subunit alcohol dehydrogenase family)
MELGAGKVAVVTGAGSGIGLALSNAFAGAGCAVVLADVQEDALAAAADEVGAHGVDTLPVHCDVSKQEEVDALAASTLERFGAVHVVCNNAGVGSGGDPWFGPIAGWEWTMGVNFWGVVYGVRAFLPHLVTDGGHIVNTASMAGLYPGLLGPYDASKHAVVALTENLYNSLRAIEAPVGVSCLCPGWVKTQIHESDRNWPDELGEAPVRDAVQEIQFEHFRRAIDEGMQPSAVADLVIEAVRDDRYWIIPHPEWMDVALERWHRVAERANPEPPEDFPGLPPRSEMIAEMTAAMAAMAESDDAPG